METITVLPLWLLILTSLAPYGIETDDLQGRLEVLVTLLLSTIAFLYIVQESIPKIDWLVGVRVAAEFVRRVPKIV